MIAVGRAILAFLILMGLGYLTIVVLLPPPSSSAGKPDEMTGQSAAARLSDQARALADRRPSTTLQ